MDPRIAGRSAIAGSRRRERSGDPRSLSSLSFVARLGREILASAPSKGLRFMPVVASRFATLVVASVR